MTDESEWGPWVAHDGTGCPCVGMWVHLIEEGLAERFEYEGRITEAHVPGWVWSNYPRYTRVILYRVRKPRALRELIEMVETLPAPQREGVDA